MRFIEITHKEITDYGATMRTITTINLEQVRRYSPDSQGKTVFHYSDGGRFCSEDAYEDVKKRINEPDEIDRFYIVLMNKLVDMCGRLAAVHQPEEAKT